MASPQQIQLLTHAFVSQLTSKGARQKVGGGVPPKYFDCSEIMKVDPFLPTLVVDTTTPVRSAEHARFAVPDLGPAPVGKPRLAATTRCAAAFGSPTPEADIR